MVAAAPKIEASGLGRIEFRLGRLQKSACRKIALVVSLGSAQTSPVGLMYSDITVSATQLSPLGAWPVVVSLSITRPTVYLSTMHVAGIFVTNVMLISRMFDITADGNYQHQISIANTTVLFSHLGGVPDVG